MITAFVTVASVSAYCLIGAVVSRRIYVEMHRSWFDEKIAERREANRRRSVTEDPEEILRKLRKDWGTKPNAQGEAIALGIAGFFLWFLLGPLFLLARTPAPSKEEQRLINEALEEEIRRLRRQVEE